MKRPNVQTRPTGQTLSEATQIKGTLALLLVMAGVLPGCSGSKLYDDQWPPKRMYSPQAEYDAMGALREGDGSKPESKRTFLQTARAAEIESHLNSQ